MTYLVTTMDSSSRASWFGRPNTGVTSVRDKRGAGATDTVSLSPEARMLLGVATMLAKLNGETLAPLHLWDASTFTSSTAELSAGGSVQGVFEAPAGTAAGAMVSGGTEADGTGVSMGFAFRDYGDRSVLYAGARGSEGDDVIDISAFSSGSLPGSTASVRVEGKGGNDTITVKSNGAIRVEGGAGDDTIAVTASGKSVMATADVEGGAGNDTISLIGGGLASGGGGDDVIHIQHTSSESAAIGFGGAGDDVIIGVGHGNVAFGGDGNDTISGVGMVFGSAGDDIIALDNSAYSRVYFRSGATTGFGDFGHATVILSDPAAGVGDNGRPYFEKYAFDNQGNHILAKPADADGNYSGKYANYLDVLPTEGQAGYGLTHTIIDFHGYRPDQIDSTLNGTDLTLSVRATGQSVLLRNYQPGRVTFSLFDSATGEINASRQPPGLLSGASP